MYASIGIWNAGIPLGDEGVHALKGMRILEGRWSSNAYYLAYAALLSSFTNDPVAAHIVLRVIASLASTIGLYFVIRSFRSISPLAAAIASIAWAGSALCSPLYQSGNVNLFSFALVLPGLAYMLLRRSLTSILVFAIGGVWAASVRPEYFAPLFLVLGGALVLLFTQQRPSKVILPLKNVFTLSNGILIAGLVVSMFTVVSKDRGPSANEYLLQGLGQCYGVYYKRLNPEMQFDPMTEYQGVLNKVFGNPRTFTEALSNNPSEAARYFIHNGSRNLSRIIPRLLHSGQSTPTAIVRLLFVIGTVIGIWRLTRRGRMDGLPKLNFRDGFDKILLLLLFTSASSAAIILLIADPRYWITWVPLVYLWFAWAVGQVADKWRLHPRGIAIALAAIVPLAHPAFFPNRSNQPAIYAIRDSMQSLQRQPVVAGNFVYGLVTFAFSGKAKQVNTYSGLDPEGLRSRYYDVFVADGLERTSLWAKNRAFFESFVRDPEAFGYRVLPEAVRSGMQVYIRSS